MKTKAEILPSRLREIRLLNKLSMKQMAEEIDSSDSRISIIENGGATLPLQNAMKLCDKFGVSLDYLYCRETEHVATGMFAKYSFEDLKFALSVLEDILDERYNSITPVNSSNRKNLTADDN